MSFNIGNKLTVADHKLNELEYTDIDDQINEYCDEFFKFEAVYVAGTCIGLADVLCEIEYDLSEVSALLVRGKLEEAGRLNTEVLSKALVSLIIDALASV